MLCLLGLLGFRRGILLAVQRPMYFPCCVVANHRLLTPLCCSGQANYWCAQGSTTATQYACQHESTSLAGSTSANDCVCKSGFTRVVSVTAACIGVLFVVCCCSFFSCVCVRDRQHNNPENSSLELWRYQVRVVCVCSLTSRPVPRCFLVSPFLINRSTSR